MPKTSQTLEYNKKTGQITSCEYDEGFLVSSNDITTAVMTLALEKLYDDYGLDIGDEVVITNDIKLKYIGEYSHTVRRGTQILMNSGGFLSEDKYEKVCEIISNVRSYIENLKEEAPKLEDLKDALDFKKIYN